MNAASIAAGGARLRGLFAGRLNDVFAGAVCAVVALLIGLSYAALIFSGPLAPFLAYGVGATFVSTAVCALTVALFSSIPFAIAGPESSTSAVTAVLCGALAAKLIGQGEAEHLLAPTLLAIAMGAGLAGLFLFLLGVTRAGRAVRFVPYPVIGGFLGATGVLIVMGAFDVATGLKLAPQNLGAYAATAPALKLLASLGVAAALATGRWRSASPFVLPLVLAGAVALFYVALFAGSGTVAAAQDTGWLFRIGAAAPVGTPWTAQAFAQFPWRHLPLFAGDLLAVMFVTTISALLNTTGIEIATHREASLDRELNALGLANLAASVLGGYVGCLSLNRTALGVSLGATSRLAGVTVAAIAAGLLFLDPGILGLVPRPVLGGLLLVMGLDLVQRWLFASARRLSLPEYLSLLAIVAVIVGFGFVAGVAFGVVIGCAAFALSVSRVNAIKFGFDGARYRSSLDRSADELALLAAHGAELQGLSLQSYLFFGSATGLYQHVKGLLGTAGACRFLVFDFRLVTGIDSSAVHSFTQIRRAAEKAGTTLVLVNLSNTLSNAFRNAGFFAGDVVVEDNLDRALELCENALIETHRGEAGRQHTLAEWLSAALEDRDRGTALAGLLKRVDVTEGTVIARQGAPSDSMHFILDGRVGIVVDIAEGRSLRIRSLGRHTTIGEMGLLTRRPRSANVVAETAGVLYELSAETYDDIRRNNPALSQALLAYVVRIMGERLSFANQTIGILQR